MNHLSLAILIIYLHFSFQLNHKKVEWFWRTITPSIIISGAFWRYVDRTSLTQKRPVRKKEKCNPKLPTPCPMSRKGHINSSHWYMASLFCLASCLLVAPLFQFFFAKSMGPNNTFPAHAFFLHILWVECRTVLLNQYWLFNSTDYLTVLLINQYCFWNQKTLEKQILSICFGGDRKIWRVWWSINNKNDYPCLKSQENSCPKDK